MLIHIEETESWKATQHVMRALQDRGGNWLLWVTDGEGCMMCPANTRQADMVMKYWPETCAGVFNASCAKWIISRSMSKCRYQAEGYRRERTNQPWKHRKVA